MSLSMSPTISAKELFLKACEEGNLELARVLLTNGADINWREDDPEYWSGLHYAAHGGHRDLLDLLIKHPGVDVNIETMYGQTPLMLACSEKARKGIASLLRGEGLQLNTLDIWGETALHRAVLRGCVQELRGASDLDWNLKDGNGETPLLTAARLGLADSLEIILTVPKPFLDLSPTNNSGYSVTWLASRNPEDCDSLRCLQFLSDDPRVDWNTRDEAGDTPLLFCLKNNKIEFSSILLNNPRVDHNVQDQEGKFAETIAREKNLTQILDLMWSGGCVKERMSECPVCFKKFSKFSRVHQCQRGHFVCGNCQPRVQFCPTCRGNMIGRAHGFEDFLQKLDI